MSREAWIVVAVAAVLIGCASLYGAVRLARRLFALRGLLGELGAGGKVAFYGALLYAVFPIDILPDPIYLDDMAVLGAALAYLTKLAHSRGLLRLPGSGDGVSVPQVRRHA
jgi:hypothetical protein